MPHTLAIVGATGAVGDELLAILAERGLDIGELRLFASARSAGQTRRFRDEELTIQELSESSFAGVDVALFSAGAETARTWAPRAAEAGARVVDNSSAFRMDEGIPLVVPEINPEAIGDAKIIANPNCTTIILDLALAPLLRRYGIRRGVVATYQAASGAGREAMEELEAQTRALLEDGAVAAEVLPAPLGFNLIPHCDVFLEDGFTREEAKVLRESRKILGAPELKLSCTAVRVPILRAHSESVTLELEQPFEVEDVRDLLANSPGLRLLDRRADGGYPMPMLASGNDPVIVGRIRKDPVFENGLSLFLSGDQLRKGAALNAVQIAELILGAGVGAGS